MRVSNSHFVTEQPKLRRCRRWAFTCMCRSAPRTCDFLRVLPDPTTRDRWKDSSKVSGVKRSWFPGATREHIFWGGRHAGLLAPTTSAASAFRWNAAAGRERAGPNPWSGPWNWPRRRSRRAPGSAARKSVSTRVSLGVQSFQPALLEDSAASTRVNRWTGLRTHPGGGFPSVNLDLMLPCPDRREPSGRRTSGSPWTSRRNHLSTYCLTFEEDTALG